MYFNWNVSDLTFQRGTPGRGRGVSRRGTSKRGRGGKGAAASPKTRAKPVEETAPVVEEAEKPGEEKDESMDASDGNFMDGFQLVDEVQEE